MARAANTSQISVDLGAHMNVETRLRKLEQSMVIDNRPLRILVAFVDPLSKEATSMLAMSPGMERRWFEREPGESEGQMNARVHRVLGWDDVPPPDSPMAGVSLIEVSSPPASAVTLPVALPAHRTNGRRYVSC